MHFNWICLALFILTAHLCTSPTLIFKCTASCSIAYYTACAFNPREGMQLQRDVIGIIRAGIKECGDPRVG